jgi:hypothetical protein
MNHYARIIAQTALGASPTVLPIFWILEHLEDYGLPKGACLSLGDEEKFTEGDAESHLARSQERECQKCDRQTAAVAACPSLSPKSRLRSMEHVKEHGHAEATKCINERRENRHGRNSTAQRIEDVEDERPH